MRKTAVFMGRKYADDFLDLPDARFRIMAALPVPQIDGLIKLIHNAIHAADCTLVGDHWWRYESLFNRFKSSDNRNWRERRIEVLKPNTLDCLHSVLLAA